MITYKKEEQSVNVKRLGIRCLKKWRTALAAAAIGVALMVGMCAVTPGEIIQPDNALVTANQKLIDSNNAAISECQKKIDSNNHHLKAGDKTIAEKEKTLANAKAKLEEQQGYLSTYESLLNEANRLKNSVSSEARVDLIAQISDLTGKIQKIKSEIATAESTIVGYEKELAEIRQALESTLSEEINTLNEEITSLQQKNESLRSAMEPHDVPNDVVDYIKYAIVGMFLGVLAVVCYVMIRYMFGRKVDCAGIFGERYEIPVLADLHVTKSKYNTGLDRWIEKQNGEKRTVNAEAEYKLLAAKLYAINPEENGDILVVSTADSSYASALCDGIKKHLQKELEVNAVGDPVRDAGAAQAVKNACVVLAERIDESAYADIDRMLEQLSLSNAKVLGCVLL